MKDYKRLTERDEFGNADIIGLDSNKLASNLDFDGLNKLTFALNKFADLEDKIERGEIDYVADNKTERTITDLLIEFDEMGFAPTTLCPNSEKHAIEWREKVWTEFERLEAENAELKARLEKAVELPCQYGDEIYSILNFGKESIVLKGKCERVMYEKSASVSRTTVWGVFEDEWQLHPYTFTNESLKFIFKTRKEAETRLAELKKIYNQ